MHELITTIGVDASAPGAACSIPLSQSPTGTMVFTDEELRDCAQESDRSIELSAQDEQELGWNIINDNCSVSRDRLVRANLRLVVAIAKAHAGRGTPLASLIGQGTIGLVRAVQTFDPARGARFSMWGSWWIKAAMRAAMHGSGGQISNAHA